MKFESSEKKLNQLVENYTQVLAETTSERYKTKMYQGDELDLVILRGHLLIEEKLELIIDGHFLKTDDLRRNLRFQQKSMLAQAICDRYGSGWFQEYLWPTIESLNRARNDLAHNLEPKKLDRLVEGLCETYQTIRPIMMDQLGGTIPPVPGSLTSAAILRLLIHWCLDYLDQLLAVTFASEISFTKMWMLDGRKIIEETLSHLSKSKWEIIRTNAESRFVEILDMVDNSEGDEEREELRAFLDKAVPNWRELFEAIRNAP